MFILFYNNLTWWCLFYSIVGLFWSTLAPRISNCMHLFAVSYLNITVPSTQTVVFTGQHGRGVQMRVTCWRWFVILLIDRSFNCQCGLWTAHQRGLCMKPFNDPCWPYVFFSFFWNLLNTNSIPVILYQCVWPVTSEVQAWSWLAFFAMGMAFSSSWPPGKEWALAATGTGSAILDFKSNRKGLYKQCESSFLNNRLWVWSSLSIRLVTH